MCSPHESYQIMYRIYFHAWRWSAHFSSVLPKRPAKPRSGRSPSLGLVLVLVLGLVGVSRRPLAIWQKMTKKKHKNTKNSLRNLLKVKYIWYFIWYDLWDKPGQGACLRVAGKESGFTLLPRAKSISKPYSTARPRATYVK